MMQDPRTLAAGLGLATADTLPERAPEPEPERPASWADWPARRREAFRRLECHAVCLVATDGPVSVTLWEPGAHGRAYRRFGHNRGCWPARVSVSRSVDDTVSPNWDKSPFWWTGVQIRLWTAGRPAALRLAEAVTGLLGEMSEAAAGADMMHGWHDMGPEVDLGLLAAELATIAERLGVAAWDDDELPVMLDRVAARLESEEARDDTERA